MKSRLWRWTLLLALLPLGSIPVRAAEERHDTVVILLDASGSMRGGLQGTKLSRMAVAKTALKTVLQKVPPTTHIGLLVFSAANLTNDWAYPLGPRDDAQLFAAIDSIQPGNATPLGRYIKIAADRLLQERGKEFGYGTYRLLVVTDGEAQDQDLVERHTPEVIARGITVDVIGVAMNQAHTLATRVHSYRRANDPAALSKALAEIFAEVRGGGSDTAGSDPFAVIAPLPDKVAAAMIQAVANPPNQPIGEKMKAAVGGAAASTMAKPVPVPAPPGSPTSPIHSKKRPGWLFPVIIVSLLIVSRLFRKVSRR